MRNPRTYLALCLTALLAYAVGTPAVGSQRGHETFAGRGSLFGERVRFEVVSKEGQPQRALFTAKHITLGCEDGTTPRVGFERSLPFVSGRVFQGQRYEREPDGDWTYFEVRGQLLKDERATGYLFYAKEPYDPPAGSNRPECGSAAEFESLWDARRVK